MSPTKSPVQQRSRCKRTASLPEQKTCIARPWPARDRKRTFNVHPRHEHKQHVPRHNNTDPQTHPGGLLAPSESSSQHLGFLISSQSWRRHVTGLWTTRTRDDRLRVCLRRPKQGVDVNCFLSSSGKGHERRHAAKHDLAILHQPPARGLSVHGTCFVFNQ